MSMTNRSSVSSFPARRAAAAALAVAIIAPLACGGDEPSRPSSPRAQGAFEFATTLPQEAGNTGAGNPTIGEGPGLGVPRDSPGFIAPGELARLDGSILVSLNEYRGLQVIDVSGPQPQLLGAVAMPGRPVALFRDGTDAFAVIADAEMTSACAGCPPDGRAAGSQVHAVHLRDPRAPAVRSILDVPGSVVGARLRGRRLDLVSRGGDQPAAGSAAQGPGTRVLQVDLTDAAAPRVGGSFDLPGPAWTDQLHFAGDMLYLALYGSHRFVGGACVPSPPVGAPGTSLPEGCSHLVPIALGGRAPAHGPATPPFPGRVAPGGLDLDAGVLRVLRAAEETVAKPGPGRPAALLGFRAGGPDELVALGELALPPVRNGSAPLFRFAPGRAYVATDDPGAPVLIAATGPTGPPVLAGRSPAGGLVLHFVEATADRLLTVEQQGSAGQCPVTQLALHNVAAGAAPTLRARQVLSETAERRATLLPGGLVLVPARDETIAEGALAPLAGLELLEVDPAAGTIARRGRTVLGGRRAGDLIATGDGRVVSLSPERLDLVDVRDRNAPTVTGAVEVSRWVEDVRFAGGHALTLVTDPHGGRTYLHLSPAADPDAAHPLATLALEGQTGRMFVHDRFVYLFWHASLRVGRSDPRLDIIEVVDGGLRLRASRSLAGPASLPLGPENDGDGSVGQGIRQVGGTTFVATLSRVTECGPAGDPGRGASSPGSAGACAGTSPRVVPTPLAPAPAIEDLPAAAEARRRLDGDCPGSGADLLVIDASDPAAPRVASLVRLPGGGELGTSVVQESDGARTLFVLQNVFTRTDPVPAGAAGPSSPGSVRRFVVEIDVTDPAAPVVGPRVNVPGDFLGARADTWFTAEPTFDPKGAPAGMAIAALYRPAGSPRAYLERRLLLEGRASGPVMDGNTLYATVEGELVAVDLASSGRPPGGFPRVVSRTRVPGATTSGNFWAGGGPLGAIGSSPAAPVVAADIHRVVGQHAFLMFGGRAMRIFDVRDPVQPRLLDRIVIAPRGAHPVRLAPGNRAMVPRAEWGLDVIDLGASR
jgi:hypothetical protein